MLLLPTHTITVLSRPAPTRDRQNNRIVDWSTATRTSYQGRTEPLSSSETDQQGDQVITTLDCFLPPSAVVTEYDRAEVDGVMSWGPGGTTSPDTTLYRGAAGRLKTDGSFHAVQNILVNTTSVGAGVGVVAMANATTIPTANPTGGGVLYVDAGALKYRGSSGTVTTIAPA